MLMRSAGKNGDRVSLTSPLHHAGSQDCSLVFDYYAQRENMLTSGALEVIILSRSRIPVAVPFNRSQNHYNSWISKWINLWHLHSFYVVFVAEQGKQFTSDIMLDNVVVNCEKLDTRTDRSRDGIFHSLLVQV